MRYVNNDHTHAHTLSFPPSSNITLSPTGDDVILLCQTNRQHLVIYYCRPENTQNNKSDDKAIIIL